MKKGIIALGLLASLSAYSQESYVPQAGEGIVYFLPKTKVAVDIIATKVNYQPGEFSLYASRYLRLNNISSQPESHWEIKDIQVRLVGVPDSTKAYIIKVKDKSVASNVELTDKGIVKAINTTSTEKESAPDYKLEKPELHENVRKYMTEDILMAGSSAKMAELTAREIYNIRESRNALLRGETDTPPQDGNQLKLMLDNLQLQDEVLTEMFKGKAEKDTQTIRLRITPEEMKDRVVFRFSQKLGLLDKDDLAGEPYYLSITNLQTPAIPAATEEDKKKELEGVAYNVPGRARIVLMQGNRTLTETELPVTQFGTREYLAPVLFNKNSTTKVLFDTATGGLIKVDREQ